MQNARSNYLSYPLIVSCYDVYVFQTVKQSTKDNQSYKQYSNAAGRDATGRDNQSESSIAPSKQVWWGHNNQIRIRYDIFGLTQTDPKLTCNVITTFNIMKITGFC